MLKNMKKSTKSNVITLGIVVGFYVLIQILSAAGALTNSFSGQLVPICAYVIMAVSLNLTVGMLGELSLGHAGFMSVGAFSGIIMSGWLLNAFQMENETMRLVLAMLAGGVCAAIAGVLIGIPVLRLRGDYLAVTTLGFSEIIRIWITNAQSITNGALGIKDIPPLNDVRYIFLVTLISFVFITLLVNSSYGRAFKAIREDEIAAEAMGINLFWHKNLAFMVSAFFAGIGGGLYGALLGTVDPKNFLFTLTYNFLLIIVLGGMGSITGSAIGAIIVTAGLEYLRFFDEPLMLFGMDIPLFRPGFRMVIFSVLLMVCVLFWRHGIMGTREFSWQKAINFVKNPLGFIKRKGAAQ